eukprot:COSAG05_NODE_10602_length_556_cov_0.905908_1_plen_109_part_10
MHVKDTENKPSGAGSAERHRIEHAQILSASDLPRLAPLNVIASMQPTHATSDSAWVESRIGAFRCMLYILFAYTRLLTLYGGAQGRRVRVDRMHGAHYSTPAPALPSAV